MMVATVALASWGPLLPSLKLDPKRYQEAVRLHLSHRTAWLAARLEFGTVLYLKVQGSCDLTRTALITQIQPGQLYLTGL